MNTTTASGAFRELVSALAAKYYEAGDSVGTAFSSAFVEIADRMRAERPDLFGQTVAELLAAA